MITTGSDLIYPQKAPKSNYREREIKLFSSGSSWNSKTYPNLGPWYHFVHSPQKGTGKYGTEDGRLIAMSIFWRCQLRAVTHEQVKVCEIKVQISTVFCRGMIISAENEK